MMWAGLRWSDVQRLKFSSLVIGTGSLRAWTWRSKTSVFGIPFGAIFVEPQECSGVNAWAGFYNL